MAGAIHHSMQCMMVMCSILLQLMDWSEKYGTKLYRIWDYCLGSFFGCRSQIIGVRPRLKEKRGLSPIIPEHIMCHALLEPRYRERTPNFLILFSVLSSLLLHLLLFITMDLRQSAITPVPKDSHKTLKIQLQPRLTHTPSNLSSQKQERRRWKIAEPATNKTIPVQVPSQNDTPVHRLKDQAETSSKDPPKLDITHLDNITRDIVKKLIDKEQQESPELSILEKKQHIIGEDLPILPELDRALKRKHASVQKLADGLIRIILPSGRSYCFQEREGGDMNSPGSIPQVVTNCP